MKPTPFENWKARLADEVRAKLNENYRNGFVAMSADNLFAILRFPSGGPLGPNAAWSARMALNDIVASLPPNLKRRIY